MKREYVLTQAAKIVTGDRQEQYGNPEDNFARIAKLWRAYLETTNGVMVKPLDGYDVACMMILMKVARMRMRPKSADSAIDAAGYAACASEILGDE